MMKKNSTINDRILYLIDNQLSGNKKKFAERIGYKPQVISNIVSGRKTNPSYDVLLSILSTFVDVSADWLLTGEGEMLRGGSTKGSVSTIDEKDRYIIDLQKRHIEKLEEEIEQLKKEQKSSYGYRNLAEPDQ